MWKKKLKKDYCETTKQKIKNPLKDVRFLEDLISKHVSNMKRAMRTRGMGYLTWTSPNDTNTIQYNTKVMAWLHLCVNFRPLHLALIRAKKYSILRTEKNDFSVPGAGGREMTTVHGYVICNFGSWCWVCLLCLEGIVSRPSKTKACQSTEYTFNSVVQVATTLQCIAMYSSCRSA